MRIFRQNIEKRAKNRSKGLPTLTGGGKQEM